MERMSLPEMTQNPIPIPQSQPLISSSAHYSYYPSLPQNPTPNTTYASHPVPQLYYSDPSIVDWGTNEAVRQYGSDSAGYPVAGTVGAALPPNGMEQLVIAQIGSSTLAPFGIQPLRTVAWKKQQKKTKIVQSAYCEVCKVDCNSNEVLNQHKLGKKHKKNMEKLKQAAAGYSVPAIPSIPFISSQENTQKANSKKKAIAPAKDLETKRRKVVEGGAAVEAVRMCSLCNVVCNSETVFRFHLSGQKHAAKLKKQAAGMGVAIAT